MGPSSTSMKVLLVVVMALVAVTVRAADPDPLQDFCIANVTQTPHLNGYPCQDPTQAATSDFIYKGLKDASIIDPLQNPFGGTARLAFARDWPALNTLGVSLVRLDLIPGGVIAPHTHNLATEVVFVTSGELYIGFVANSDNVDAPNKLFACIVEAGEAFVIPRGLVHFQMNKGVQNASSINFLNSHNPGISFLPLTLFGALPAVDPALLARSFQINESAVNELQTFWSQFNKALVP